MIPTNRPGTTPTSARARLRRGTVVLAAAALGLVGIPVVATGGASAEPAPATTGISSERAGQAAASPALDRPACDTPTDGPRTPAQLQAEQRGIGTVRRVACLARWRPARALDTRAQAQALAAARGVQAAGTKSSTKNSTKNSTKSSTKNSTKSSTKTKTKTTRKTTTTTTGPGGVALPSSGRRPADLAAIYGVDPSLGAGMTVGLVVAYDHPLVEDDLAVYRASFGLPACTTANGCFRKVNQRGGTSLPSSNAGWGIEIAMDVQSVSAICPRCRILLVEADSDDLDDVGVASRTAAALGADVVSHSYGAEEFNGVAAWGAQYYGSKVVDVAASGDAGYGTVMVPAVLPNVIAVGGTTVTTKQSGYGHTAWSLAGSGCSKYVSKPSWQTTKGCANRAVADVSALADNATGMAVYDTFGLGNDAGWLLMGGTSLASPLVAAMIAMSGNAADIHDASGLYTASSGLLDVRKGRNGNCSSLLCKARSGWDGPTGVGTPQGLSAF